MALRFSLARLNACLACAFLAAGSADVAAVPGGLSGHGNDTGVSECLVDGMVTSTCLANGQDAANGRDVSVPNDSDGSLGFSYTKVGASGELLSAGAGAWSCVVDNVTGLMWEVKTTDGSARDVSRRWVNTGMGADDASVFIAQVNAAGLCGATDWRLPNVVELQGLVDYSKAAPGPMIDTAWLGPTANTPEGLGGDTVRYWTSVQHAEREDHAWGVGFDDGKAYNFDRLSEFAVRLVRDHGTTPPPVGGRYVYLNGDTEVHDTWTDLIWQRCAMGQAWNGVDCGTATPIGVRWDAASTVALDYADATGVPWRLPNSKELITLVEYTNKKPAMDAVVFPGFTEVRNWFWTGTFVKGREGAGWLVGFANGHIVWAKRESRKGGVRLVRDAVAP